MLTRQPSRVDRLPTNAYIIGSGNARSTQPRDTYVDGHRTANTVFYGSSVTANPLTDLVVSPCLATAEVGCQQDSIQSPDWLSELHFSIDSDRPFSQNSAIHLEDCFPLLNTYTSSLAGPSMAVSEADQNSLKESPLMSPAKSSSPADDSDPQDARPTKNGEDDERRSSSIAFSPTSFKPLNHRRSAPKHNDAGKFECQNCHQIFDRKCEWK